MLKLLTNSNSIELDVNLLRTLLHNLMTQTSYELVNKPLIIRRLCHNLYLKANLFLLL